MPRKYGKFTYWCLEFTDTETGLITEVGSEQSFDALTAWALTHLKELPHGGGKFVQRSLRKR